MKINPIRNISINFKSYINEDNVLAYDDEILKSRRNAIRDHYNSMLYYNVLENNGRLSEYELDKLITSLVGKNVKLKNINSLIKPREDIGLCSKSDNTVVTPTENLSKNSYINKIIKELYNVKPISGTKSSYRGSVSNLDHWALKILSEAGIKNVIALTDTMIGEEDCRQYGINFVKFSKDTDIFDNNIFQDKNSIASDLNNVGFKKEFINFIKTMQEDNVYIGCEFGTLKTDDALMLNHFFNPKAIKTNKFINDNNKKYLKKLETLYKTLTHLEKEQMGWARNFDQKFLYILNDVIKKYKV